jgi:hypothetical protein
MIRVLQFKWDDEVEWKTFPGRVTPHASNEEIVAKVEEALAEAIARHGLTVSAKFRVVELDL